MGGDSWGGCVYLSDKITDADHDDDDGDGDGDDDY